MSWKTALGEHVFNNTAILSHYAAVRVAETMRRYDQNVSTNSPALQGLLAPEDVYFPKVAGTTHDMPLRMLIAEDDLAIRTLLVHHLEREGYTPICAGDGQSALRTLRDGVALVLLDIGLPGIDGLEIARIVRREGIMTPLLFLTARADEVDRIVGLELGADDYIIKPFSPRELMARMKAVLRRSGIQVDIATHIHRFDRLEIDSQAREARIDGSDIDLKPREFDLLMMFAQNIGVALSRDKLIENVWGIDFDGDVRTIDVHVRRLRAKLEEKHGLPAWIQTVHGHGYKFTAKA